MSYNDPHHYKDVARMKVNRAVYKKKMVKPSICSQCSYESPIIHGHHDDYYLPMSVIWLCPQCHKDRHQHINNGTLEKFIALEQVYDASIDIAKSLLKPLPRLPYHEKTPVLKIQQLTGVKGTPLPRNKIDEITNNRGNTILHSNRNASAGGSLIVMGYTR